MAVVILFHRKPLNIWFLDICIHRIVWYHNSILGVSFKKITYNAPKFFLYTQFPLLERESIPESDGFLNI